MLLPGATDRVACEADVEHILVPALRPGQIVLLDTLSAHHSVRVQRLVAACQCEVWVLPSYSPDFSPIEHAFAKVKQGWRKAEARTLDTLYDTIGASLASITSDDAHSFFTACG
jgi:transposase